MATLEEVLDELRAMDGYIWDRPKGGDVAVKLYTFWFTLNPDYPDDINDYVVRILVKDLGEPTEEALPHSIRHLNQATHEFRDDLREAMADFIVANEDYEKGIIDSVNETAQYGTGRAVKTVEGETTIVDWIGFIEEGETTITLRLL